MSHPVNLGQWWSPAWPSCLVERFTQGMVIYNPCAGTTHRLNELAGWVLERLAREPAQVATLVMEAGENTPEAMLAMVGLIQELERLGLVSPWEG